MTLFLKASSLFQNTFHTTVALQEGFFKYPGDFAAVLLLQKTQRVCLWEYMCFWIWECKSFSKSGQVSL